MKRVILDTDLGMGLPGAEIDDGFALALLLSEEGAQVEFISTVHGNIDVESATYLTGELLSRLGRSDLAVIRGAAAPLIEPERARAAPTWLRERYGHHAPRPGFAASAIAEHVLRSPGEITIIAIGPLTNVATAMSLHPDVAASIGELVVMGGAFASHTHMAAMPGEFNWWADPHAARAVLHSGVNLRLVGLDVTTKVLLSDDHVEVMRASERPFGRYAGECTAAWLARLRQDLPGDENAGRSCPMHDPLAVAAVFHPELLTWTPAHVDVVAEGSVGRGVAIADLLVGAGAPPANAQIATEVRADAFMRLFLERITGL